MKKRLLALALCLVMVTSLLPVTTFAENWSDYIIKIFQGLKLNGVYCEDVQFEFHPEYLPAESNGYNSLSISPDEGSGVMVMTSDGDGKYTLHVNAGVEHPTLTINLGNGMAMSGPSVTLKNGHNWSAWTSNGDGTHSRSCSNGCGTRTTEPPVSCADKDSDHKCDDCGASVHTWQFKAAGNTLTGYCGGANCDIKEIVLTLKADSVTLPKSPFETAELVGWKAFTDAIPSAYYNSFDYKLNGEDVTDKSNPKAGNYQVGVRIYGLPSPVEYSGVAARANMDGNGYSAYLYTQYTAVDPAITAQTGDNRPIELMVGSVVVFSALAAAAFIVDSKRRSQH